MSTERIKKSQSDNCLKLYEAVAIIKLIDHSEETDFDANIYGAAYAVAVMVDAVADTNQPGDYARSGLPCAGTGAKALQHALPLRDKA
jgi:hypothetical protein